MIFLPTPLPGIIRDHFADAPDMLVKMAFRLFELVQPPFLLYELIGLVDFFELFLSLVLVFLSGGSIAVRMKSEGKTLVG